MLRLLYILALAIGIVDFITLYYFEFDRRSETELVRLSFFWAVPIVFGLAGLTAEFFSRSKNSLIVAAFAAGLGTFALAGILFVFFG